MKDSRTPVSIPKCNLVTTHNSIKEAFSYSIEFLSASRTETIHKDTLIVLQMIQNTLSEHYDVYDRRPENNPPRINSGD